MTGTATVFDVQRFSIHDGPGIRTTVFFKGCPLRCAWCQNPESLAREPELAVWSDRCEARGDCARSCPRGALQPVGPRLDRGLCDVCGACVPACPHGALEVIGRTVTVPELLAEVERDRPFFESSGEGGVTLSGGEPTMQLPFVLDFVAACAGRGLRVGLQTCGLFPWAKVEPLLASLQFVYFDLKIVDGERSRRLTGADSRGILDNARRIAAHGVPVTFRTPVVPGFTDDADNLRAIAALLSELGSPRIGLLRYHRMGEAKLGRLGSPLAALELSADDRGSGPLAAASELLRGAGLEVVA